MWARLGGMARRMTSRRKTKLAARSEAKNQQSKITGHIFEKAGKKNGNFAEKPKKRGASTIKQLILLKRFEGRRSSSQSGR